MGRTSRGTHGLVPWRWFPDAREAALGAVKAGFSLFVVENSPGAHPLQSAPFPGSTALVFGNEAEGVSPEVIALAMGTVVIPQAGERRCLNVASAAAAVAWEILRRRLTGCSPVP